MNSATMSAPMSILNSIISSYTTLSGDSAPTPTDDTGDAKEEEYCLLEVEEDDDDREAEVEEEDDDDDEANVVQQFPLYKPVEPFLRLNDRCCEHINEGICAWNEANHESIEKQILKAKATLDSTKIREFVEEKDWNTKKLYLVVQREFFIHQMISVDDQASLQVVQHLYHSLRRAASGSTDVLENPVQFLQQTLNTGRMDDVEFIWSGTTKELLIADHNHFLYIASEIVHAWNNEIKKRRQVDKGQLLNHKWILRYLHVVCVIYI